MSPESRVKLLQGVTEIIAVEVGIDLGSSNAFVPQHFLNGTKVGPAFHQVSGKGMPESMWGNGFGDTGFQGQVFNNIEDHDPAQTFSAAVQEKDVFSPGLNGLVNPDLIFIDPDVFGGITADGDQSFFIAFAGNADKANIEIDAGDFQADDLAHAQSAAVHGFQDGFVTGAVGCRLINLADDCFDFAETEHIGQVAPGFRGVEQYGWIGRRYLLNEAVFIKAADAGNDPGLGSGAHAQFGDPFHELLQIGEFDSAGSSGFAGSGQELGKFIDIAQVGLHRVFAQGAFEPEKAFESFFICIPHNREGR